MRLVLTFIIGSMIIVACGGPAPKAITYGNDQCAACKMGIADSKFGSELVTTTGKTYMFDSPECMIEFTQSGSIDSKQVHSLWVTDFINPGTLIDARSAWYLESEMIKSPMGLNVAAFVNQQAAERARINYVGTVMRYDDVVTLVVE